MQRVTSIHITFKCGNRHVISVQATTYEEAIQQWNHRATDAQMEQLTNHLGQLKTAIDNMRRWLAIGYETDVAAVDYPQLSAELRTLANERAALFKKCRAAFTAFFGETYDN